MKYIIPIIVGGLIGYATNWLAIKMLFRPYYEKRFLGFKVPFTPGLIPKEKTRIAKNIGETVGEYLLSPKAIREKLLSEKTNKEVKLWIQSNFTEIKKDDKRIKDLLEKLPKENLKEIKNSLEKFLGDLIIEEINKEENKNIIMDFMRKGLYNDNLYEKLSLNIRSFLEKVLISDEIESLIESKIDKEIEKISKDKRLLKEVLSEKTKREIESYLDENIEGFGDYLRKAIKSPKIQMKMKKSIAKMVDENISRLITSFISPESISEKIYTAIEDYINGQNSNEDILFFLKSFKDEILEKKISDLGPEILGKIDSKEGSKFILAYMAKKENQEKLFAFFDKKIKDIDREKIIKALSKEFDLILENNKIEKQIRLIIKNILDDFMNKPILNIVNKIEANFSNLYQISKTLIDNFIIKELPKIIEKFNISKIVEDEINKFDVEFTEKLILDIASKELKAITRLGALLGGILGLLSPLLQLL